MGNSATNSVALQGDIKETVSLLSQSLQGWRYPDTAPWWETLRTKMEQNVAATQALVQDNTLPLNYYAAFDPICKHLNKVKRRHFCNKQNTTMMIIGHLYCE